MSSDVFGKYRAIVTDVKDPESRGRVIVSCPAIFDESASEWCEPCVPFAVEGGDFVVPPVGSGVWIEFEGGDTDYPIYTGCWYCSEKSPIKDYSKVDKQRIIAFGGAQILFESGFVTIKTKGGKSLKLNDGNIDDINRLIQLLNSGAIP